MKIKTNTFYIKTFKKNFWVKKYIMLNTVLKLVLLSMKEKYIIFLKQSLLKKWLLKKIYKLLLNNTQL